MNRETPGRRTQILEVAERLFRHYGPGKTTIADIARACGIGVGSVYLDFSSKEAIVEELTRERTSRVAARVRRAVRARTAPERLVAILRERVEALFELADEGQHGCDLVRCGQGGFDAEVRALLVEALREGAQSGELHGSLARAEAERALESIELAFLALSPPTLFRYERAVAVEHAERLATVLVYGLTETGLRSRRPTKRSRLPSPDDPAIPTRTRSR